MSILKNVVNYLKRGQRIAGYNDIVYGGIPSFDIGQISTKKAMTFTPIFAAIRLRSEMVASLPKVLIKADEKKGFIHVTDNPVYTLIHRKPNNYTNAYEFWAYINACLDGWGNAYAIIKFDNAGNPVSLHQIHPSNVIRVEVLENDKRYTINGTKFYDGTYLSGDILHFMGLSINGVVGLDPITYNSMAISTGLAATKFGDEYFKNGGNVKAVMETDSSLAPDEYDRFIQNFKKSTQGNHSVPLLEYGVKYKPIGVSPEAAQMISTKTFSIQDVSRIFNIPPHLLGDLSHATFSNIEEQNIQFVTHSILPAVKRYETELENKLLRDDDGLEIKFNLNGLLRGNTSSRGEFYNKMLSTGTFSRNDVRRLEGLQAVEGLDTFLYPANMLPVGEVKDDEKKNE